MRSAVCELQSLAKPAFCHLIGTDAENVQRQRVVRNVRVRAIDSVDAPQGLAEHFDVGADADENHGRGCLQVDAFSALVRREGQLPS